jgi:hypothetical protein
LKANMPFIARVRTTRTTNIVTDANYSLRIHMSGIRIDI